MKRRRSKYINHWGMHQREEMFVGCIDREIYISRDRCWMEDLDINIYLSESEIELYLE